MSRVRTVEVAADDAELRLDRWFRRHFPGLGHGRLEKLLRTGQVRLDGGRVKSSTRLTPGQQIRIPPIDDAPPPRARPDPPVDAAASRRIRGLVIYRDDHVIVLNKPPGLAVQGGSKVANSVDAMLDGLRFDLPDRPRLAHRLDKDTSGILLIGRTPGATARLGEAFRSKTARKTYWAITAGVPKPARGRIDLAVAKQAGADGRERVRPDAEQGKRAITYYAVIQNAGRKAAWLAMRPVTGRTHQLRVHCAAIGTPILGDGKYGGRDAFVPGVPGGESLHLHAHEIDLPHPAGGRLNVVAPLPDTMLATWRFFGFDPSEWQDPFAELED